MAISPLKPGQKAPDFTALNQEGKEVKLSDFKGKKLVLFFYPKDNTPTCTVEACNLRDNISLLKKSGYEVVGISADSVRSHGNFAKKFSLPFDILSDPDRKIIDAYGVWGEKMLFGRVYDGIHRVTFVIDEKGKISRIIDKVESKNHAEQILAGE